MKNLYFIDFENIQNLDYNLINKEHDQIVIFTGQNQTKINIDIIKKTQPLGKSVEWVKMEGSGRNALDFHIAFYLGYFISLQDNLQTKTKIHVISKDGDYDNIIKHIQSLGYVCERKVVLAQNTAAPAQSNNIKTTKLGNSSTNSTKRESTPKSPLPAKNRSNHYSSFLDNLKKLEASSRPQTNSSLLSYIASHYRNIGIAINTTTIVDQLKQQKIISQSGERINYNLSIKTT